MDRLVDRFIKYAKIDTQSDPNSRLHPSTEKQKDLGKLLVEELKKIGIDGFMDDKAYVYGLLEKNVEGAYKIGFIAHMDTSFDAPGKDVKPRIIQKYDGSEIILNNDYKMSPEHYPSLKKVIGDDLIVTDGHTLLGADDKLGIAEIMEMLTYFVEHPEEKHGDIYVCFTPDEEIGEGANFFNFDFFKADFAYTSDGGDVESMEYENFNAATAEVTFIGKSIHPGSAKNKMINSVHLAMEFHQMLPIALNPALTEGYEGFNHLTDIKGGCEQTQSKYIIRNHDMLLFNQQKSEFESIKTSMNKRYGYEAVKLNLFDTYYNMETIIKQYPHVPALAWEAIKDVGLQPRLGAIRGGTDGARLTYQGLPCPNIGTGGFHYHGRLEFASIRQMHLAVQILIAIVKRGIHQT
jgi:tripeptide aminopeptidase